MRFDYRSSAGFVIHRLARLMATGLGERLRPLGLGIGVFPVLLLLWEEDGRSQSALARCLGIEQATMANTLARMERDGLITRTPHSQDGRQALVLLTAKARALEAPATRAATAQNAAAMQGLSEADRAQLLALCGRMIAALQQ